MSNNSREPRQNPFEDPLYDPFAPEVKRVEIDGQSYIDVMGTVGEFMESQLPEITSDQLRPGDELTIGFDDQTEHKYRVEKLEAESLAFGSDDVRSPKVYAEDVTTGKEVILQGSSIGATGNMSTPGKIGVGLFLNKVDDSNSYVSDGTISTFSLKRPTANGELREVNLNESHEQIPSESYSATLAHFKDMQAALEREGFNFADSDDDEFGVFGATYSKVIDDTFVYAARQGFGSAIVPQDEIYTYDSTEQVLRGLRYLPTKGILQAVLMEGVTPESFAKKSFSYRGEELDWRECKDIEGSTLHRLSSYVPFVSYSWLNPEQTEPTITVLFNGKLSGESLKADASLGGTYRQELQYAMFEMNIRNENGELKKEPKENSYWVVDKESLLKIEEDNTHLEANDGILSFNFENISFTAPLEPKSEAKKMAAQLESAVAKVKKYAGKRAISIYQKHQTPDRNK